MGTQVTRRRAISMGATVGTGLLAGCATVLGETEAQPVSLDRLVVNNNHDQPHVLEVLVLEEGEPVYLESCHADAFDDVARQSGGCVLDGHPTEPGVYQLFARRRDASDSWTTLDLATLHPDRPCVAVMVFVDFDSSLGISWHPC